jgi:hypothetical protein
MSETAVVIIRVLHGARDAITLAERGGFTKTEGLTTTGPDSAARQLALRRRCSSRRGMISTKLQGRWR